MPSFTTKDTRVGCLQRNEGCHQTLFRCLSNSAQTQLQGIDNLYVIDSCVFADRNKSKVMKLFHWKGHVERKFICIPFNFVGDSKSTLATSYECHRVIIPA